MNIIKIAKRFSIAFKEKITLNDVYTKILLDKNLRLSFNRLTPTNAVKIIYIIWGIKNNKDPEQILDLINTQLFAFSLVEFDNDDPLIKCSNCDGDGEFDCDDCNGGNIICVECDGDGTEECWDCDGTGQIDDEECSECRGSGELSCKNCDGEGSYECGSCGGSGTFTCIACNGHGDIESEDHVDFSIYSYLSFDKSLLNKLTIANDINSSLEEEFDDYIYSESFLFNVTKVDSINHPNSTKNINKKFKGNTYLNKIKEIMDYNIYWIDSNVKPIDVPEISNINEKFKED